MKTYNFKQVQQFCSNPHLVPSECWVDLKVQSEHYTGYYEGSEIRQKNLHYREKTKMAREVMSAMQARTQEVLSLLSICCRICFNIVSFIFHNTVFFVILMVKSKRASWQIEFVLLQLQLLFRRAPSGCSWEIREVAVAIPFKG